MRSWVRMPLCLAVVGSLFAGCSRTLPSGSAPTPVPRVVEAPVATSVVPRVTEPVILAAQVPETRWRVTTETRLRPLSPNGPEQRVQTSSVVVWRVDRRPDGALRGVGAVEDFRVLAGFVATSGGLSDSLVARIPLDLVLDSVTARVVSRPPLINECDRLEAAASAQARHAVLRVPDGIREGSQWRDSTVSLSCRNGTPITIYTSTLTRVDGIDGSTVRLTRESVVLYRGIGGTPFRAVSVTGTGTGRAQIVLRRPEGILDRFSETTTSRLTLTETPTGRGPREQQMEQQVTIRVTVLPLSR